MKNKIEKIKKLGIELGKLYEQVSAQEDMLDDLMTEVMNEEDLEDQIPSHDGRVMKTNLEIISSLSQDTLDKIQEIALKNPNWIAIVKIHGDVMFSKNLHSSKMRRWGAPHFEHDLIRMPNNKIIYLDDFRSSE